MQRGTDAELRVVVEEEVVAAVVVRYLNVTVGNSFVIMLSPRRSNNKLVSSFQPVSTCGCCHV